MVCARPDKPSDLVIDETNSEPAATVPATPMPVRTWAKPMAFASTSAADLLLQD